MKLVFTGADRLRYLNGQLTAKIARHGVIIPACVTTAKGKLCADVFVGVWENFTVVDADAAVAETLPARLEKYIVADDVQIEDATARLSIVHFIGLSADEAAAAAGAPVFPVNRFGIPGFEPAPLERWAVSTELREIPASEIETLRIENGVPRWGFELDENTLPAEAGLDRTHVDFHKGCYIGQEVISRVKSVGHVNRNLARFAADAPLTRGARIFSADSPAAAHGVITSTATTATSEHIALGYLRRGAPESGLLCEPGLAIRVR